jgi:hypothetical protein
MEFLVYVLCHVEDACHLLVCGHAVVGVESVDDTLLGLSEGAVAGNAAHHYEARVVRVDGS